MKWLRLAVLGLLCFGISASAQLPPDKIMPTFKVSDGLELSLWASEPLLVNPTSMDVDHLGRVWVCEAANYRAKANPPLRGDGDRIVILEDTKNAGKADKATVFYQGKDLSAPLGIAVAKDPVGPGYKVYVCQSPNILLFEDKDGDGKADGPPTKFLTNFGGQNHDHGVHGLLIGPDNKFYFTVGDSGVNGLQSTDKKGPIFKSNGTDCRAGTVWRCNLDGTNLQLIGHNFRNNYEPCVDSFGTVFLSDNDDDGNQQTRICYVVPGGDHGYHPRGPGQTHWHEEKPGVVPKILRTYFGSPCGICTYEGNLLPEKYRGQLLHVDAGPRHVRCYHLKPSGAGYDVEQENMVQSTDNWFRPSDVCVAADGSVFVADWYDPGVGGHGMGDWTRGRIFRLAPKGNQPAVPKVNLDNKDGILAALASPNLATRAMAQAKIAGLEQKEAVDILEAGAIQKDNPWLRARCLWHLARVGRLRFVNAAFEDKDPNFRLLALRALKDFQNFSPVDYPPEWKTALLNDSSSAVRREALLLLRDVDAEKARPLILELAKKYDGKDVFYRCAVGIAVGAHDKARRDIILKDFDKAFPEWNEAVASLVWELRPPAMMPALEKKLADAKIPAAQRAQIVDILSAGDDGTGATVLLKALQSDVPADVRDRIVDSLKQHLPGKWKNLRTSKDVADAVDSLLKNPDTRPAALAVIAAAEKADAVDKVAALAKDAKEKPAVRSAAVLTLGSLPAAEAAGALDSLLSADPVALRGEAVQALGKLSQSTANPAIAPALQSLQRVVLDGKQDNAVRVHAVAALGGSHRGCLWLLDTHDKKQLPEALLGDAGRVLRNTPYKDLRARAHTAFPPPGKIDPKKLPSPAVLAAKNGNVAKGKALLAASANNDLQCLKCHTVQGVGGSIGPDLSMIGKKASKENLHESLLLPSKAIADQFLSWIVETKAGLVLTGLIVEETPEHILLRDANGKDTKVLKKDIESRTKDTKSLMPENTISFLSEEELIDVVEYLFTLKSSAVAMDYWRIVGPFDNGAGDEGLDKEYPPEKGVDLTSSYDGKSGKVTWNTVKPDSKGYVDLMKHHGSQSNQIVSYLYREVESPVDQDATVQIGADDCSKLWVNGALVHTNRKHVAATPGAESVKVKLKKGKNTLLLKVTNGDGPHGFYFMLLADEELKRLENK